MQITTFALCSYPHLFSDALTATPTSLLNVAKQCNRANAQSVGKALEAGAIILLLVMPEQTSCLSKCVSTSSTSKEIR